MPVKEKARQNGEPIPNAILAQDRPESKASLLNLQVSILTRRCAVSAAMAETLAPLAFAVLS